MKTEARILVIDDDPILLKVTAANLKDAGHYPLTVDNGQDGMRLVFDERPDLVLLDVMMPGMDGFEVTRRIRELTDIPIIMITARQKEEDIIHGLEMGADDYIVKPFRLGELMARVNAALRRATINPSTSQELDVYVDDWLNIDLPSRTVEVNSERIKLSATEFNLLALLLRNSGRVLETNQILKHVWGPEYGDEVAYVRVYISHLRQKIEPDPSEPIYLHTERQVGYRFVRQDET